MHALLIGIKTPILRPLIGMDKEEIVGRSKKLELWRADHAGCCAATPKKSQNQS
ncbi:hypothetical protein C9439_03440 [archaeon SCG-AAA382B04]|nr:hypothetical protein C9439_03440 [archaeon SCG-AAA382B04]